MKLLVCVVNNDDTYKVLDALVQGGHYATLVSTTGGLLRQGNSTILSGVEDEDLESVLKIIKANSHSRMRYVNPMPPMETGELYMPAPVEVPVSGAVVFCLNVDRFAKF